jgi:hypothetical protein
LSRAGIAPIFADRAGSARRVTAAVEATMDTLHHPDPGHQPAAVVLCDGEDVRDLMAYWLTTLSISPAVNLSGADANRVLQAAACRLLVTDRIMPLWPGLATFLQLRLANPALRIAFVDNGNLHTAILARVAGATDVLPRPLTRKALADALGADALGAGPLGAGAPAAPARNSA